MIFNKHFAVQGSHALLGASKSSWVNYDLDKLDLFFEKNEAAKKGTRIHALAAELIDLRIRLPRNSKTLNLYVNDAIGFRMKPEVLLYYSENCFGTPDAISFSEKMKTLRISDLKTGETPASERQLLVYAALFFLEYGPSMDIRPMEITTELRIYQGDEVREYLADPEDIVYIMDKIITFDARIKELREEGQL